MTDPSDLQNLKPDHVFDGGDLDCGSGLILLIRENMLKVREGGVLEMRSREPTVGVDLPPWCRMVGHEYLGSLQTPAYVRYFMRRDAGGKDDDQELQKDRERARSYEWRLRTRSTGHLKSTVYCRNFSFDVGQPASFEEKDQYPSAVEYLLGALSASLSTGFATEAARAGLEVDDIEITAKGSLENALALLGDENGDPVFSMIEIKCFASTLEDEKRVREIWEKALARSPIAATLRRAVDMKVSFVVV
ncbi:MAG TPA: OsmC family protein [Anaerolineales bacterium]|nr:OsmC family protein [Anaerolineales bacterium]